MVPKLRFTRRWRRYAAGDAVPDTFDAGVRGTLLDCGLAEPVPDPVPAEPSPVTVSPDDDATGTFRPGADKAIRTGSRRVKQK